MIDDCQNCGRLKEVKAQMVTCQENELDALQEQCKAICRECVETLPFSDEPIPWGGLQEPMEA